MKDSPCYNVKGCQYTTRLHKGMALVNAPFWKLAGVKAYQAFQTVFFLDRIERVSHSSDEAEAAILETFRTMQLRCRDGEVTAADYAFMKEHMMIEGREAEFAGPETYNLVTTRAARDEKNNLEFAAALERGAPSITIDAINSSPVAAAADDKRMQDLPNQLHLCLGARVMIIKNLCTSHGLCNGTIGLVHDIIVNAEGFVTAVVLKVRRATLTRDGYKGPAYREGDDGVDASEVLVAVNRRQADIHAEGGMQTRQQFPLMLAWALTIHKAQGLTLERVVIDAAEDEQAVGLLFVAMTRVRHPKHIAFSPWPGLARVTSVIATKADLRKRKEHEVELRELAAKTARRLLLGQPPPPPAGTASPGLGRHLFPMGAASPHTGQAAASRPGPPKPSPLGSLALPPRGQKKKRKAPEKRLPDAKQPRGPEEEEAARRKAVAAAAFAANTAAVTRLGLPPLSVAARSSLFPRPTPMVLAGARAAGLVLEARVVDFWSGSQAARAAICTWLRDLGFGCVTATTDCAQIGLACGYVAARATGAMFAAGDSWRTVDLSDAAQAAWIHKGNAVLRNGKTCAVMLESQDVYLLTQAFHEHACPDAADLLNFTNYTDHAYPCQGWPLTVDSLDWFAREVASSVTDYAAAGRQGPTRAFFTTNTDDCRKGGVHWISVAISMRWDPPPPL